MPSFYQQLENIKHYLYSLLAKMPNKTQQTLEAMARRVCKEEAVEPYLTEIIIATIWAESRMNQNAINTNKNGSVDYGIAQFNDGPPGVSPDNKWWIGPKAAFSTPAEVLKNPEKCVRVMCRVVKEKPTGINNWYGYTTGAYRKYLAVPERSSNLYL